MTEIVDRAAEPTGTPQPILTPAASVELFAGAGGLALGCQKSGFNSVAVVERDRWACDTIRENKANGHHLVADWHVYESDVRSLDLRGIQHPVTLVAGGPPCQPFSAGGRSRGAEDARDMFPITASVIADLRPAAFIIENVRGLTRATFADYYEYIQLRLSLPTLVAHPDETWFEHLRRLRGSHSRKRRFGLHYNVVATVVNAADYGVPQQRWRVFFVGFRGDLDVSWTFPQPTHSRAALMRDQWVTGDYWRLHRIPVAKRPAPPPPRDWAREAGDTQPWQTVRDALADLPEPMLSPTPGVSNHLLQPGARSYPGHTGSPMDLPAKALKAGGHGVPGGENMLRDLNGNVRYFTVRESARLQTFPDDYELHGSWGEAMRQLGNAVPVHLAEVVAGSVFDALPQSAINHGEVTRDRT